MIASSPSDISSATGGWFPVFTLLLGYFTKYVSDWVHHKRDLERDRETRKEARRDQLAEHLTTFQRQTLLDLQEAVMDVARTTGAAHHLDEMAYREIGQWQKQLLGDDLDQESLLAMRRTAILSVRVRDSSLRELVKTFRQCAAQTSIGVSRDASNSAMNSMAAVFEQVQERVGELLRTLDDEEASL
jgi:hypothetical protein